MALILELEKRKMPEKVKAVYKDAYQGKVKIIIPTMVLAELAYLSEKKRIDTNLSEAKILIENHDNIIEYPLSLQTIEVAFEIDDIPELHDRLIAASAIRNRCALLTNDPDINNSNYVKSIWSHRYG